MERSVVRHTVTQQVLALARQGQQIAVPSDVLKDPFVLDFLALEEKPTAQERDLEQAIIDHLSPRRVPT